MTSTVPPKHYALLVGIDMYLNDGSRKNWNGESVSFNNLRGCVNDVRAVQEFLQNEFQVKEPCILTSSVPSDQPSSNKPTESPEFWPTFDNIKREFESITEKARGGDYFLFHFSGHGAQLQPTQNSPKGRLTDPSLITIDYCNSNAAVRGWQLNEWLKTLHEKNVRIIVILDSCYAGGSWRTGEEFGDCFTFRTPEKWKMVPNNSNDEAAVKETSSDRGHRDGEMETSWGMNPQGFTLLAACAANQQAEEKQYDGEYRGVFTFALLACLRQSLPDSVPTTYQNLRDQIHEWLRQRYHQQTPRVYGQDRLVFFGSTEPFAIAPIIAHIKADTICIPIGKFHGIHVGSEFTTCQSPLVKLSVDNVRDFQCSASIPAAYLEVLPQESYKVIPYRWSLGNEPLFVFVDQDLGSEFRQSFDNDIRNRIVGDIQISRTDDSSGHNNLFFKLTKSDHGGIDLSGPPSLIGYRGSIRGLNMHDSSVHRLSITSAITLRHLARFSQVLGIERLSSTCPQPFQLKITRKIDYSTSDPREKFQFNLQTNGQCELFCKVLVLGPGFNIKQLYPPQDSSKLFTLDSPISFAFRITIPDELKDYRDQRNILRTIITKGKPLVWRCLELPHIWNASHLEFKGQHNDLGRDAKVSTDQCVWILDEIIHDTNKSTRVSRLNGDTSQT